MMDTYWLKKPDIELDRRDRRALCDWVGNIVSLGWQTNINEVCVETRVQDLKFIGDGLFNNFVGPCRGFDLNFVRAQPLKTFYLIGF